MSGFTMPDVFETLLEKCAAIRPHGWPRADTLLHRIAAASRLAGQAESSYAAGEELAGSFHATADQAYCDLLGRICALSDEEADFLEPALTALEQQLFRLAHAVLLDTAPARA